MSISQLGALARRWYRDRLSPAWQPRDREASQALIAGVGLIGAHWRLPG